MKAVGLGPDPSRLEWSAIMKDLPPDPTPPGAALGIAEFRRWYLREVIGPARADGSCIPILPRHGIYLDVPGRRGDRFVGLFRETWRRIPLGPRRRMLRHWRDVSPLALLSGVVFSPSVGLLADWPDRAGQGLRGDKAVTSGEGHKLRFHAGVVRRYPDALVCDLIAHELAHVVQWAEGRRPDVEPACEVEEDADGRVEAWGFSADAIDEFDRAHGITRVIDLARLGPEERDRVLKRRFAQLVKNGR